MSSGQLFTVQKMAKSQQLNIQKERVQKEAQTFVYDTWSVIVTVYYTCVISAKTFTYDADFTMFEIKENINGKAIQQEIN